MTYDFWCDCGETCSREGTYASPPVAPPCQCGRTMYRRYGAIIDTSGCKDHDDVPLSARVAASPFGVSAPRGTQIEKAYAADIAAKRKAARAHGKKGSLVMRHSIPTELYHGKIKQTGDKDYWRSEKNLRRHRSCEVA